VAILAKRWLQDTAQDGRIGDEFIFSEVVRSPRKSRQLRRGVLMMRNKGG